MAGIVPGARLAGAATVLTLAHVGAGGLVGSDGGAIEIDCGEEGTNLLGEGGLGGEEKEVEDCSEDGGEAGKEGRHSRERERRKRATIKAQTLKEQDWSSLSTAKAAMASRGE